jgi:hypothetical protein
MNLRFAVVVLFTVASSACVTVEMPKHMVSDAVGAGKDLYRSVERAVRKTPKLGEVESNSEGSEFWLYDAGSPETAVGDLKRACLETLVAGAREKVGVQTLDYRVLDQRVEARDSGVLVHCQIAVERPRGGA